jgi:hypothetical protein
MSCKYASSVDSTTYSLSSLSAVTSVRDETFKKQIDDLKKGPTPLPTLVGTATKLINILAADEKNNNYKYGGSTVKLHAVLLAMLDHAENCGGEDGKRYTAAAICLCAVLDDPENKMTLQMLRDLSEFWISHLLFICKYEYPSMDGS